MKVKIVVLIEFCCGLSFLSLQGSLGRHRRCMFCSSAFTCIGTLCMHIGILLSSQWLWPFVLLVLCKIWFQ
jgi:hypothetical protein